jgi:hypothetical protein
MRRSAPVMGVATDVTVSDNCRPLWSRWLLELGLVRAALERPGT